MYPKDNITLGEGRGNAFIMFLKKGRKGDCGNAINSYRSGTFGGNYTREPSLGECLWKKMIGKPYSGKPNVRFDEEELEMELLATTPVPYATVQRKLEMRRQFFVIYQDFLPEVLKIPF
jgi:hypothetical protein